MQVMKANLKEKDKQLLEYGCSAHWLNFLGQEVTPTKIIEQIIQVNKYFPNHHVPALLTEHKRYCEATITLWNKMK